MRIIAFLGLVLLASCSGDITAPMGARRMGAIVARDLQISIGGAPSMHVKDSVTDECGTVFLIRKSTLIFTQREDGKLVRASETDLKVGARVTIWADTELRSCPGQSVAKAVQLLSEFGS